MKSRMGRMLLLAIGVILGSGSAYALGAKGDGMGHQEKGMMTDEGSMKKQDQTMKEKKPMQEGPMDDTMKQENGMMKSGGGMQPPVGEKAGTMKDTMK